MNAHQPDPFHLGRRVVVRYRLSAGSQPPLTDVVGVVTALDGHAVTLESRRGPVTVERADVVAVKAVPPAPVRRGRPHIGVATADLERLMAQGWCAVEEEGLGDWLLRASSGFTRRGNSVLTVGDPGFPDGAAVEACERWYTVRGLPATFHVDLPPGGALEDAPLAVELLDRGYRLDLLTLTMTGASDGVPALTPTSPPVTMDAALTPAWLQAYSRQRTVTPGVTEQVLTGSAGQLFASVQEGAAITALARMSVHPAWAGIHGLWVDPGYRRQALGRTVVQAVAMLAREHRMGSLFLQVEADNDAAIALYQSIGFGVHHSYAYLTRPPQRTEPNRAR